MQDDWFVVTNLNEFINSVRALVFNTFGQSNEYIPDLVSMTIDPDDIPELDSILSYDESKIIIDNLIRKQKHKNKKSIRYLLNDNILMNIVTSLNDRMVSNILNNLVNKGLIETAYDNDANDFVFWIKDDNQEKPETD